MLTYLFFFFFFFYIWLDFLQTGTISRYNTAESHSLMHYSQLCGTHQPRLCALELLPKEFTGGISDDPCRALHSNAARPRHTCAALITLLPNSLTWLGEPVAYGKRHLPKVPHGGIEPETAELEVNFLTARPHAHKIPCGNRCLPYKSLYSSPSFPVTLFKKMKKKMNPLIVVQRSEPFLCQRICLW